MAYGLKLCGLCPLAGLLLATACGSDANNGSGDPKSDPAGTAAGPSTATAGNFAQMPNEGSPASSAETRDSGPTTMPAPTVGGGCAALAGDACAACLCERCRDELDSCAGTEGCLEILTCVRESACAGSACYCGDASLPACVGGQANGACKQAVLAAPGGREPTLTNPSGGPASDAALAVAQCAQADVRCREACAFSN